MNICHWFIFMSWAAGTLWIIGFGLVFYTVERYSSVVKRFLDRYMVALAVITVIWFCIAMYVKYNRLCFDWGSTC